MKKYLSTFSVCLLALGLVASLLLAPARNVVASTAITPVAFSGVSGGTRSFQYFNGNITADTRVCYDLSGYSKIDLQWKLTQGTTNTTALYLQWTNIDSTAGPFEAIATIVSANAATANDGYEYNVYGRYVCVFADVANANSLGIKVIAQAK